MQIKFKKIVEDAKAPELAYIGDNGFDLFAVESAILHPNQQVLLSTGIAVEIPENVVGMICPRSGLANKNCVTVLNGPGIVDSTYRGIVSVLLINHSNKVYVVNKFDRIAQMLFVPTFAAKLQETDELSNTSREAGGFGSSGV